ncbi:hypothetical protein C4K68_10240 [Pokkaliibacter plantistimulans]|uniref:Uncharacterized protein n=1 Tax=Proteobacteria bacterium 228 TaxID=2083153 RepID=A0A2S5KRX3_9PROT|nr:hypothetical protein C4K68_10240 [Pokkaliibacter plantistimulans]
MHIAVHEHGHKGYVHAAMQRRRHHEAAPASITSVAPPIAANIPHFLATLLTLSARRRDLNQA